VARTWLDAKAKKLLIGTLLVYAALIVFGVHDCLDIRFFYTGEVAKNYLNSLTPSMHESYIRQCLLDIVFIHFYTSFAAHQFGKSSLLFFEPQKVVYLKFLPLVPGALDFIETSSILWILVSQKIPESLDWLGYVTAAKWSSGGVLILFWIFLLLRRR
jgi:hypothetical protein